ncbi:GreA/GreB family elongation factor [Cytobacillus oceanisediminis]|uniref:Transcription elongation factor GreA n=1 Tax=Cytobacillus oceanisediminis TaxID=665099 RepID=A0A562JWP4_9BACI|nr:GreA/GreB family elongation factor [Cytobacillus oceanisediminis]TWH87556.1 transcription elongation factor GreA [Cytobacillus oceanisediminis]
MNHSLEAPIEKEFLIKQLTFIDENYQELNSLYLSSTPLKERIKDFLSIYVREVEQYITLYSRVSSDQPLRKVFIGTKVTLLFEGENDREDYHICLPEHSDPDNGCISFLSPVGRQLLLKNLGEQTSLIIPSGQLDVVIENISYSGRDKATGSLSQ